LTISLLEEIDKGSHLFLIYSWKNKLEKKLNPEPLKRRAVSNHYTTIFFSKWWKMLKIFIAIQVQFLLYIYIVARFNLLFLFMV
jgi:hypothetical protein